ncbi:MAG TPA: hypothetical protein VIK91_00665, partial [Nannocystis sp.]
MGLLEVSTPFARRTVRAAAQLSLVVTACNPDTAPTGFASGPTGPAETGDATGAGSTSSTDSTSAADSTSTTNSTSSTTSTDSASTAPWPDAGTPPDFGPSPKPE